MASDQPRSHGGGREQVHVDGMATAPADTLGYGREMNETTVRNVSQVVNMPTDRVRWGPIWAGLLTTLTALLLLSLFGPAVGLSTINAGPPRAPVTPGAWRRPRGHDGRQRHGRARRARAKHMLGGQGGGLL